MFEIKKDIDIMTDITPSSIVLVGTNTYCTMGNGLQREIALEYPHADIENKKTKYGDFSKLGSILPCDEEGEPTIILCYIYKGYEKKKSDDDFLDYEALTRCLKLVNTRFQGKTIISPILGCSRFDGNGNKESVLEIMQKELCDCDVVVYDYLQKSREEKMRETRLKELEILDKEGREAFYKAVAERKAVAEKRFEKNKHARY